MAEDLRDLEPIDFACMPPTVAAVHIVVELKLRGRYRPHDRSLLGHAMRQYRRWLADGGTL
jgi:hypothetical protein